MNHTVKLSKLTIHNMNQRFKEVTFGNQDNVWEREKLSMWACDQLSSYCSLQTNVPESPRVRAIGYPHGSVPTYPNQRVTYLTLKVLNHTIIRAALVRLFVPLLLRGPLADLCQTWWVYVGGPRNCPCGVLFWKGQRVNGSNVTFSEQTTPGWDHTAAKGVPSKRHTASKSLIPWTGIFTSFWKFTSYCSLKPLWSGMGEVVPSPPTEHQLSRLAL